MTDLGRLERIDLRSIWASEAQNFTPWLAKEENLTILAESLNMDLELEAQEKSVGPFSADILCRSTEDDSWVLIENQLERTDHRHLGQLMTYAAGLHAVTVVWVAAQFSEEHRAALNWLNEITDHSFRFFGLEVELWKIGESPAAPKFNVVSKPNDWSRSVSQAAKRISQGDLTDTKEQQGRYWNQLKQCLEANRSTVRMGSPRPQHWMDFSIGKTGFKLSTTVNSRENRLGVEVYIQDDPSGRILGLLEQDKSEIEAEINENLVWQPLPGRKGTRVALIKENEDPTDEALWESQHQWLAISLKKLDKAFRQRIKSLPLDEPPGGHHEDTA